MGGAASALDAVPRVTAKPSRLGPPIDRPAMLIRALLLYVGYATKPQFLIVGAQKAGTTALHSYLRANPQVVSGTTKEISFFAGGIRRVASAPTLRRSLRRWGIRSVRSFLVGSVLGTTRTSRCHIA